MIRTFLTIEIYIYIYTPKFGWNLQLSGVAWKGVYSRNLVLDDNIFKWQCKRKMVDLGCLTITIDPCDDFYYSLKLNCLNIQVYGWAWENNLS
jgi:hypothetical protein